MHAIVYRNTGAAVYRAPTFSPKQRSLFHGHLAPFVTLLPFLQRYCLKKTLLLKRLEVCAHE